MKHLHPLAFPRYVFVSARASRVLLVDSVANGRVHFHEEAAWPWQVKGESMPLSEWQEGRRLRVIRVLLDAELVGNVIRVKR